MDASQIAQMLPYVDMLQVGARNMQNYFLLKTLGTVKKPVLLKRGMSATIEELLLSAEYIMSGGNYSVVLCERGIRTFTILTCETLWILPPFPSFKRSRICRWSPILRTARAGATKCRRWRWLRWPPERTGCCWKFTTILNVPFPTARSNLSISINSRNSRMAQMRLVAPIVGHHLA